MHQNNWFFVLFSLSIGINASRASGYEKYFSVYSCVVARFIVNDIVFKDHEKWIK